ncbi:MAG: DUF4173 domain-containing protein [Candidatus Eremiobacteraeota bacterium]|nr:DUF4173 domain-containing protein [Candidatus Eremiobacteraeota bacterium]MCW5867092.1 DUF4173 domain-containing protein [Candidatus Eremiobacteraeota bacterium]
MSRWFLVSCLSLASLVEAVLWGVRSGPGWLLLVALGFFLSHFLRWRLERPGNAWSNWLWLGAAGLGAAPFLYHAELVHWLAPPLCFTTLILACFYTVALARPMEALTTTSLCSRGSAGQAAHMATSQFPRFSPSTLKGLGMALPLLMLFGLLFLQADPGFQGFLTGWLGDWRFALTRLLRWALWAWLAGTIWLEARFDANISSPQRDGTGDAASWTVALQATNLLFLTFLGCQARYLFAGLAPAGMTLAGYARHGFFELCLATLLVVALVVWVHGATYRTENGRGAVLASQGLLLLTFGLVASSTQRMILYVQHFGLTLTRAYVLATLVGIVATLVLCCWALAQGRSPQWLRARLFLLGMFSLAGVGLTNVEAWVARTNLARKEVDMAYLRGLSSDIAPVLNGQKELLAAVLTHNPPRDWREFTWSYYSAQQRKQADL